MASRVLTSLKVISMKLPFFAIVCFALTAMSRPAWSQDTPAPAGSPTQHIVVVIDDSGSMKKEMKRDRSKTRMQAAKQSLIAVLESLPANTHVGVVALNARRHRRNNPDNWIVPLGPIDKPTAVQAIQNLSADGGTPLGTFMKVGADALLAARATDHYGTYRLLLVTDGEASGNNEKRRVNAYLPDILARGITTDVIGLDMGSRHSLATQVHTYRAADDPASLTQAVKEVFAETSADSTDAGESDFDLVAALPDDVAAAVLTALSTSGNHPIGTPANGAGDSVLGNALGGSNTNANSNSGGVANPSGPQNPFPNGNANQNARPNRNQRKGPSFLVYLVIGLVIFNIVKAVFRTNNRNS